MKIYKKKKRQIAGMLALIMVISSLMGNLAFLPVLAAEGEYPYMMFASSGDEGAITLTTNNVGINGNVATNGSIVTSSQNVNINGTRTENLGNPEAYIGMPDIGEALEAAYFSANTEVLSEDYALEDTNININTPLEGEGSIELTGNITLNAGVMAEEDLVFSGEVKNTGDVVIYSATGDVVIESTNVNVNGLIYAPHGEIRINSMNLNMNNVILIAEKITIEANGINGGKNRAMAAFIGEDYAVIGDESGDNPSVSDNEGENGNDPSVSDNEGNVSDNTASDNEADGNNDIMEGVVYLDTSIGGTASVEIYYKEIASDEDIVNSPEGLPCVRNQMLVMVSDEKSFEEVENYMTGIGAAIVGYVEITNDYQIEFLSDKDVTEIATYIEMLENEPWVDVVGYNYLWLEEPEFCSTDPWKPEDSDVDWNSNHPLGSNWGIEEIDLLNALVNADVIERLSCSADDITTEHLTSVRIGVIDNAFDEWHEDLDDNFLYTWNNFETSFDILNNYVIDENSRLDHGTHVVGIMGAEFNNDSGITGICLENEIVAFALDGNTVTLPTNNDSMRSTHTFEVQCALGVLIINDVKVINFSYGMPAVAFAASQDGTDYDSVIRREGAREYLDRQSRYIGDFLDVLIDQGYDFLIVSSAGNANTYSFYRRTNIVDNPWGYIQSTKYDNMSPENRPDDVDASISYGTPSSSASVNTMNYVQAEYNSVFNYISENYACYDHIICVGALAYPSYDLHNQRSYSITDFTCSGNRVDILAPGEYIYSCIITDSTSSNYAYKSGTSMAAPFVSGAIGLAYNIFPDISAAELKQIIISSAENRGLDANILNVADMIREVKRRSEMCEVILHVTDENGNPISNASIEMRSRGIYYFIILGGINAWEAVENNILYSSLELQTDENGNVSCYLPEGHYYAVITEGDNQGETYHVWVRNSDLGSAVNQTIVLSEYNNQAMRYLRFQVRYADGSGDVNDANIILYEGWNTREGTVVAEAAITNPDRFTMGRITVQVPEGIYTALISDTLGNQTYCNVIVNDATISYVIYL